MKRVIILPLLMSVLMILACTGEQKLGEFTANATAKPVTLLGEVNHVWNADVEPGIQYEITVVSKSLIHPLSQVEIIVFGSDRTNIATPTRVVNNIASVSFWGPESKQVRIEIYSLVGERQENLGEVEISLKKST